MRFAPAGQVAAQSARQHHRDTSDLFGARELMGVLLLVVPPAGAKAANSSAVVLLSAVRAGNAAGQTAGASLIAGVFGKVTSAFRTVAHNREVGGVLNSYHLQGRAIDIARRKGVTHLQVATALRLAGYQLIESLDEGDHSHFAFATAFAQYPIDQTPAVTPAPELTYPLLLADQHGVLNATGSSTTNLTVVKAIEVLPRVSG